MKTASIIADAACDLNFPLRANEIYQQRVSPQLFNLMVLRRSKCQFSWVYNISENDFGIR